MTTDAHASDEDVAEAAKPRGRSTKYPSERLEIPTSWMMAGMRERRTPAQFEGAAKLASFGATDEALRRDRIIRGYDNLISNGFITRNDVYFSVPQPVRSFVPESLKNRGSTGPQAGGEDCTQPY